VLGPLPLAMQQLKTSRLPRKCLANTSSHVLRSAVRRLQWLLGAKAVDSCDFTMGGLTCPPTDLKAVTAFPASMRSLCAERCAQPQLSLVSILPFILAKCLPMRAVGCSALFGALRLATQIRQYGLMI
jgi:hypothetical protein